jgi:hypothetical protein
MRRASDVQRQRAKLFLAAALNCPRLKNIAGSEVGRPTAGSDSDADDADESASPKKDPKKPITVMMERPSRRTLIDALASVAKYSFHTPNFIFVCGSDCKILRSADRCRTWRAMRVEHTDNADSTGAHATLTEKNIEVDEDDTFAQLARAEADAPSKRAAKPVGRDEVADILALLPARARAVAANSIGGDRGKQIAAGSGITLAKQARETKAKRSEATSRELYAIDAHTASGHVAACGSRGTLLYSIDKGLNFLKVPTEAALQRLQEAGSLPAGGGSGSESDDDARSVATSAGMGTKRALRHLVLIEPCVLFVAVGTWVVLLELRIQQNGGDTHFGVENATLASELPRDVRLLSRTRATAVSGEVIASCADSVTVLRPARDAASGTRVPGAVKCVRLNHSLGTVMALAELPVAAAALLPSPQVLKTAMTADLRTKNATAPSKFSYAADTVVTDEEREWLDADVRALPKPTKAVVNSGDEAETAARPKAGRIFAAYCGGGSVMPYDFTCALWLYSSAADDVARARANVADGASLSVAVTTVCNVHYVPFVNSHVKNDRVGIACVGPRAATWVRSSPGGISSSTDCGATWSDPHLAFTGRCIALDDKEVCVACMKPAVAMRRRREVKKASAKRATSARVELTDEWEMSPLPRSLRMAIVHDAAVLQ